MFCCRGCHTQHRGSQQVAPQEAAAGAATAPPRPQAPQVREQAPVAPAAAGATATATEESGDRTSRKLSQGIVTGRFDLGYFEML